MKVVVMMYWGLGLVMPIEIVKLKKGQFWVSGRLTGIIEQGVGCPSLLAHRTEVPTWCWNFIVIPPHILT
jgi:hypothetical protein